MKNLILIRHGKSSWDDLELADMDRPLNKRGKRDAPAMGGLLKDKGLIPDLILCSPALRARKTAAKIAKAVDYPKERIRICDEIYLQGVAALIALIGRQEERLQRVFIVGHNPDLTELANRLSDAAIDNIPTCGIASIEFVAGSWQEAAEGGGRLAAFERPMKMPEDDRTRD